MNRIKRVLVSRVLLLALLGRQEFRSVFTLRSGMAVLSLGLGVLGGYKSI